MKPAIIVKKPTKEILAHIHAEEKRKQRERQLIMDERREQQWKRVALSIGARLLAARRG